MEGRSDEEIRRLQQRRDQELGIAPAGPNTDISVEDAITLNHDNIFECLINLVFLIVFHAALYGNKELNFSYERAKDATPHLRIWVLLNQILYYIQFSKFIIFRFERWPLRNAKIWTVGEMFYQTFLVIGFGSSVWGGSFAKLAENDNFLYGNLKVFFTLMVVVRMIPIATKTLSIVLFSRDP